MARRKRLTPPRADYLDRPAPDAQTAGPLSTAPIAQVAGDAASSAALETLSEEMTRARAEGRFIESLPLDAVDAGYLVRDRIGVSQEDQSALIDSLRARGQQTAIDVVDLGAERAGGRYGLISGWRRLMALRHLHDDTGETRFALVQARITRPGETSEAYLAMIEENEIRAGLSHYERARIAVRAVEEGVFAHDRAALDWLYSNVSRAKKSKIRSFVSLVRQLDGALRFPAAIGERLGLDLARQLTESRAFAATVTRALNTAHPADAETEQAVLKKALKGGLETKPAPAPTDKTPAPQETQEPAAAGDARVGPGANAPPHLRARFEEIHASQSHASQSHEAEPAALPRAPQEDGAPVDEIVMQRIENGRALRLSGGGIDDGFVRDLAAWLDSRKKS